MAAHEADRRHARRLDKAFPVFVSGNRGVRFGIARNISEGGMFVETDEPEPLGSRILVTFAWPGSNAEMSVEAEVRYLSVLNYGGEGDTPRRVVQGIGVQFLRFVPKDDYEVPADPAAMH